MYLDLNKRARIAYLFMMTLIAGCWIWGTVVQVDYTRQAPELDWVNHGFGRGWALYILWSVNFSLAYNLGFWLLGSMARDNKEIVRLMSVARAVEAAGQCISSGISSASAPVSNTRRLDRGPLCQILIDNAPQLTVSVGLNFALWGIVTVPAYLVVRQVGIKHCGPRHGESVSPGNGE